MASVAGRHIDTRFQSTSILNKSASESSSLYQKCASLLDKLLRIRGFAECFPELTSSLDSKDPVTQIWDILSTGTPLCYIFDQLPPEDGLKQIGNYSLRQHSGPNLDRAKKRAIALFIMQLREEKLLQRIPECEMFMVTDLLDRHSTNGLVKVCVRQFLAFLETDRYLRPLIPSQQSLTTSLKAHSTTIKFQSNPQWIQMRRMALKPISFAKCWKQSGSTSRTSRPCRYIILLRSLDDITT